jgi:CRISPR-associated protein Cas1
MPDTPLDGCVPARMLNEFAYCPRLAYLEWVQGEWADNTDTLDGKFVHRNVDREDRRPLPTPDEPEVPTLHARSVRLEDVTLGLVAVVDLLELDGSTVTPIDYKRGHAPDLPEGAWEPERVQLCAQGLLLRAAGYSCAEGVIYFSASKRRVTIPFDDALVTRTLALLSEFRRVAAAGTIPPPLVDSPKCPRCSLVTLCLPDETNLLRLGLPAPPVDDSSAKPPGAGKVRALLAPNDDARPLSVSEPGARVGKSAERLVVELKGEKLAEVRLVDVSHLCLFGPVQISAQALAELADREIPVCHFSTGGWFRSMTTGLAHKNVELRIRQYAVAADPSAATKLASAFVAGKVRNCRTLLRRNATDDVSTTLAALNDSAAAAENAESIPTLMGIEGMAAKRYFAAFGGLLKEANGFTFDGRNRRPPTDPVNAVLSFLYAMLAKELTVAAQAAGFDPMRGFLHAPRYGRPSLALDLAEEFRPLLADSVALTLVNTGEIKPEHFVRRSVGVNLTPAGRRAVLSSWERRLETEVTHPLFGYTLTYRRVLLVQARLLARLLLGEIPDYPAFRTR